MLFALGLWRVYRGWINRRLRDPVRILSGHRVIDPKGDLTDTDRRDVERGCLTLDTFERAVEHLLDHYRPVALDACLGAQRLGQPPPRNAVILTFDDGYRDNFLNAYPLLREFHFPAIIFLITSMIGTDQRRSRYKHLPAPDTLQWLQRPWVQIWSLHGRRLLYHACLLMQRQIS